MPGEVIYIVTDGEFDGPIPGINSMLSFAAVAVTADQGIISEFEAVLQRLDGASQNDKTMAFWQTEPEAYAAATHDPEPPNVVMKRFVEWVRNLSGVPVFMSHPLALDGIWIDFYLRRFTEEQLLEGPWNTERLFHFALCLASYAAGKLGRHIVDYGNYPPEWLGNIPHTHRAIDDARGYAHLLIHLLKP
ncbi:MAG: DNA polymerase III subunit epsilon [Alphaproteobacteria bacterium]|nr:DNA polymerase III subunit epsilon [Alphaproteobacteria bacterium]